MAQQNLPANIQELVKRIAELRSPKIEVVYEGPRFSETPTELFRLKVEGSSTSLMSINKLPDGLQIENVFVHPRDNGVALTIDVIRDRV